MSHLTYQAAHRTGLSDIAEEFRELDGFRRHRSLSVAEAERYHALFARLSDALASGERHRRADTRQFLRVQFEMALVLRTPNGETLASCQDFGGGGCSISTPMPFHVDDDVWLDGTIIGERKRGASREALLSGMPASIDGTRYALHGRGVVVWGRPPTRTTPQAYGLRFAIDSRDMRDQVDRVMYRVLDAFLNAPPAPIAEAAQPHP
jgi:hypothetical protein